MDVNKTEAKRASSHRERCVKESDVFLRIRIRSGGDARISCLSSDIGALPLTYDGHA